MPSCGGPKSAGPISIATRFTRACATTRAASAGSEDWKKSKVKSQKQKVKSDRISSLMLRTRLWMGAILILLTAGVLVADGHLAPWYPFLLILVVALASVACFETRGLLAGPLQP